LEIVDHSTVAGQKKSLCAISAFSASLRFLVNSPFTAETQRTQR
jgi:hypothetical protein